MTAVGGTSNSASDVARAGCGVQRGPLGRRESFGAALTLVLAAACASGDTREADESANFTPLPAEGFVQVRYPESRALFAEGNLLHGLPVGPWRYHYRNGRPFASGSFDSRSRFEGQWRLWTPSGELSTERRGMHCTVYALVELIPGYGDLDFDPQGSQAERQAFGLGPWRRASWNGTGTYSDDFWQSPETPDS